MEIYRGTRVASGREAVRITDFHCGILAIHRVGCIAQGGLRATAGEPYNFNQPHTFAYSLPLTNADSLVRMSTCTTRETLNDLRTDDDRSAR